MVRASVSLSVDLRFIPLVESYQKNLKNGIYSFLAERSAFKGRLWRTSLQVCLLCPLVRHLMVRPNLHIQDRWLSFLSEKRVGGR